MQKLTALSKLLIAGILVGSSITAYRTYGASLRGSVEAAALPSHVTIAAAQPAAIVPPTVPASLPKPSPSAVGNRPVRVGLSQWPGHMGFVLAANGLRTQPGSKP